MWDPIWDITFNSQAWGKYPAEDLIRFVATNFYNVPDRSKIKILELGCGPGCNIWFLAREGFSFVGIDGSATAIEQATRRLDSEVPNWRERGQLLVRDISKLPFGENNFDAVIDNEAVYCNDFDTSKDIYIEAARVLKENGDIFVRTFATGTWGENTGKKIGNNTWLCSEGPMEGKGLTRFTEFHEIPQLLKAFSITSIEINSRTLGQLKSEVKEWIILGKKLRASND
jgi:SAM-dependent methyltransferase